MTLTGLLNHTLAGGHLSARTGAEHLMGMPETLQRWTAERVRALPADGKRYEVVDGELLVTPAPSYAHQRAIGAIFLALSRYLEQVGVGKVIVSPADIELDPRSLVQPGPVRRPVRSGQARARLAGGARLVACGRGPVAVHGAGRSHG